MRTDMIIKMNENPKYTITIHETKIRWADDAETSNDYTEDMEDISCVILNADGTFSPATHTLRELVGILEEYNYLSCYPAYGNSHGMWASTEEDVDYQTGDNITRTLRFSNLDGSPVNERNTRRIYRLAGLIK